jgi:deoxyribodipyrimidine photo-lyase
MSDCAVVWIRDDFRIRNNHALSYACKNHDAVTAIYIHNNEYFDGKREAQRWWISKSLESFSNDLEKFNIKLETIISDETSFYSKFKTKDKISIYWNKVYEPDHLKLDKEIEKILEKKNIPFKSFKGNILNEYHSITKNDGTPFKVFSPFWRNAEQVFLDAVPQKTSEIKKLKSKKTLFNSKDTFKQIMPKKNWFKKFDQYWKPSEDEAHKNLKEFISNRISKYGVDRDYPSINGSSKLSPYIRNGQIHVAAIYENSSKDIKKNISIRKYINELGWREFSHSLINYFPQMLKGNLRKEFDRFPWEKNSKNLKAWKQGMTGYPIVDAGMRELYETGWMHNRIRMVVGSFLVKHLRINWKEGEKYFRNCLLDFNEANNVAQWQWVAGCGADAAPYFRIFNPILQGEKFDKEGLYVKKWVPELKKVPSKFIHKPWEMELKYQEAINTIIGKNYPKPIVVHEEARAAALNAFQSLKK